MTIKCMRFLLMVGVVFTYLEVSGQVSLPVIKANSRTVDIQDGLHYRKGYWQLMPERAVYDYYVEIPEKQHVVRFITNQDSISFDVSYGKMYNFIIVLNGKDSCFTRIIAGYKPDGLVKEIKPVAQADTIAFDMGLNNKIYVQAVLNGDTVGKIQVDLGAGGMVVNQSAIKNVNIHFDGKSTLANSDGINEVLSSTYNRLQMGHLCWDSIPIVMAHNMQPDENLIIGNALFRNKVLEINYDKKILIIRDSLPRDVSSYTKHDIILDGGIIPYILVHYTYHHKKQLGWAMFDTGARTTVINSRDSFITRRVWIQLANLLGLGKSLVPRLSIGTYQFSGFEYKSRDMGSGTFSLILGNDLLKRFNVIVDNRNGYMYLKLNSLIDLPYGRPDEYYIAIVILALAAAILIFFAVIRIRKIQFRNRKRKRPK